ncbi:hypothetical protein ACRDNQ_18335 [Palleronia sp. KMU-117]|uniref:hypothetical protein n=1 Tax=Palleronia sp. KMU-117 TaxID=3434108 RepID=UPI003D734486
MIGLSLPGWRRGPVGKHDRSFALALSPFWTDVLIPSLDTGPARPDTQGTDFDPLDRTFAGISGFAEIGHGPDARGITAQPVGLRLQGDLPTVEGISDGTEVRS